MPLSSPITRSMARMRCAAGLLGGVERRVEDGLGDG